MQAVKAMSMQGEINFIPVAANITGIWYRKDLFAQKGVEAPTSWDNFFTAIEKMTGKDDQDNPVYGLTLRGGGGSVATRVNEIICYVGLDNFWSADGQAQILRDPKAAEFIAKTAEIYQKGESPESSLTARVQRDGCRL